MINKKIYYFISSARPNTWLRIWGEMILGACLAGRENFNPVAFIMVFIATSPLVWSGGYMLNDLTDINLDKQHPLRKKRAITKGHLTRNEISRAIITLFSAGLAVAGLVNLQSALILTLLILSQMLYTLPPFRFKEKLFLDIFTNTVNSMLRFILGVFSQEAVLSLWYYLTPIVMLSSFKTALFLGHRIQNVKLEKLNRIRSTVTVIKPGIIKVSIIILSTISLLSFSLMILFKILPAFAFLAFIPAGIIILINKKELIPKKIAEQEIALNLRNIIYMNYFITLNILSLFVLLG